MSKESKISVIHFLNKNLKPIEMGKTKKYPLYIRVRFENKKTEFKSKAQHFYYSVDIDGLVEEMIATDQQEYYTEKEFEDIVSNYKLVNERKAVFEIISFYRDVKNVNLIDHNPVESIHNCLTAIDGLISHKLNTSLRQEINGVDKFIPISKIINWENSFITIYNALQAASSDANTATLFNKKILSRFREQFELAHSFKDFILSQKRRIWLYEWSFDTLKEDLLSHLKKNSKKTAVNQFVNLIDNAYQETIG